VTDGAIRLKNRFARLRIARRDSGRAHDRQYDGTGHGQQPPQPDHGTMDLHA
jgi:hypothetical protein